MPYWRGWVIVCVISDSQIRVCHTSIMGPTVRLYRLGTWKEEYTVEHVEVMKRTVPSGMEVYTASASSSTQKEYARTRVTAGIVVATRRIKYFKRTDMVDSPDHESSSRYVVASSNLCARWPRPVREAVESLDSERYCKAEHEAGLSWNGRAWLLFVEGRFRKVVNATCLFQKRGHLILQFSKP